MIAAYIEPSPMIIKGKRKIRDYTRRLHAQNVMKIVKIFYGRVTNYVGKVIKMK
jgi:hypothetical protein